jgi:hypothetical protein
MVSVVSEYDTQGDSNDHPMSIINSDTDSVIKRWRTLLRRTNPQGQHLPATLHRDLSTENRFHLSFLTRESR